VPGQVHTAPFDGDALGAQKAGLARGGLALGAYVAAGAHDPVPGQELAGREFPQDPRYVARVAGQARFFRHATVRSHTAAGDRVDGGQHALAPEVLRVLGVGHDGAIRRFSRSERKSDARAGARG